MSRPRLPSRDDAVLTLVTGWMSHLGPATACELGETSGIPRPNRKALLRMEATGTVLRGNFTGTARARRLPGAILAQEPETEWCERRLLARIHRLTVGTLRKQIEPVTAAQFMRGCCAGSTSRPERRLSANAARWKSCGSCRVSKFPPTPGSGRFSARRIADYDPKWLDQLCLTGAVGWGRLSPHPATLDYPKAEAPVQRRYRTLPLRASAA